MDSTLFWDERRNKTPTLCYEANREETTMDWNASTRNFKPQKRTRHEKAFTLKQAKETCDRQAIEAEV